MQEFPNIEVSTCKMGMAVTQAEAETQRERSYWVEFRASTL